MSQLIFVTDYDRQLEEQAKTFEGRLCDALENNSDVSVLMEEAENLFKNGKLTKSEYKDLTNIELYKEILGINN